jgi:uncharacterized protein (DUF779 family)
MKVTATPRAESMVRAVAAGGRSDLVMMLGDGCCDSTAPFLYDHHDPGPQAVPVGEVAGVPVFAHRWLTDVYANERSLEVDVDEGLPNDSFSLESEHDARFTLRATERGRAPGN